MARKLLRIVVGAAAVLIMSLSTSCTKDELAPQDAVGSDSSEPASPREEEGNQEEASMAGFENYAPPRVHFEFDRSEIQSEYQSGLAELADMLKKTGTNVTIEGHCDEHGTVQYNMALGERRAHSVKNYLENLGVAGSQISTISYGEERPISAEHNRAAWKQNRRVEFILNR